MATRGIRAPNVNAVFAKSRVNIPGMQEAIWQPLYDYQTLSAGGVAIQRFFSDPIGSGGTKDISETNMELAGQLPKGQAFMITGIQVELFPGVAIAKTDTISSYADDILAFYKDGALRLNIGSKPYVVQGNLMKFAPVNRLAVSAAVENTNTTVINSYLYATATGREFSIKGLLLESSQNFNVELLQVGALPSGQPARVGVTLNGYLYRNAQ